ncbi:MarR family transcriptional regulator [Staphylococcus auricularis]|uniref:MarR family transcriptional regulator n=1 Tax=Staphylococcus auricularis TaxID=29379 RepID=A0AAP8TTL0_9STAP|nr:MarR family transcriptional regulator [Staphylococcus auricularis]MDC6326349.1 MarR family transcriptional regulator [Staphylococcus auricularis]MDN4533762.1 MarR family transcriptional regulator [Staphylococcus auricularis]PNZ68368.1 MarR family transcriptional regulator [Staphylococcus auricularis]QPT05642.1 MarR family transcriptional regulator [Staphylococcus auricularis]SQJ09796.1 transcriptional regulator [Staphylococcus auricularis]
MYQQLEQLITTTSNELNLVSRRFGQRADLSVEQLEILRLLYNYEVMSQYDLTMKMSKEQSIVSRWIKKLRQLGYLTSRQSDSDLRCKEILLTDKARTLILEINEARYRLIEARCQSLTEADVQQLNVLLEKLTAKQISLY